MAHEYSSDVYYSSHYWRVWVLLLVACVGKRMLAEVNTYCVYYNIKTIVWEGRTGDKMDGGREWKRREEKEGGKGKTLKATFLMSHHDIMHCDTVLTVIHSGVTHLLQPPTLLDAALDNKNCGHGSDRGTKYTRRVRFAGN